MPHAEGSSVGPSTEEVAGGHYAAAGRSSTACASPLPMAVERGCALGGLPSAFITSGLCYPLIYPKDPLPVKEHIKDELCALFTEVPLSWSLLAI